MSTIPMATSEQSLSWLSQIKVESNMETCSTSFKHGRKCCSGMRLMQIISVGSYV
jgi:hypothetical protein